MQCQYAAALGDTVMGGPTDYQCQQWNGTLPAVGTVVMPNVRRGTGALAGTYPQPNVPGDVTVDAFGHSVHQFVSGATAFTAGAAVALNAAMQVVPWTGAANTQKLGIALNGSSASGTTVDVLCTGGF
jgi:hypothetical protein